MNLIGAKITVKKCKNNSVIGMQGDVVDETKNTIVINTDNGECTLIKNQCELLVEKQGKRFLIDKEHFEKNERKKTRDL